MASVLEQLSEGNSQVLVCTHSPYFVTGKGFEDIRLIKKIDSHATVSKATYEQVSGKIAEASGKPFIKPSGRLAKVHQALQPALNEMFFTPRLVLVEGLEDIAYITTYLHLTGLWSMYRRCGCHIVAAEGKSSMVQPLSIALCLGIPTYTIFDADGHDPKHKNNHEPDNLTLMRLCNTVKPEPFPEKTLWANGLTVWPSEIGNVVKEEIGEENWQKYAEPARELFGAPGGLEKNSLFVAEVLSTAWDDGKKSCSLEQLCHVIVGWLK